MFLLIYFFIFLFSLYIICRDDFVIFRKNLSMEWVFNTAFLTALISLLSARIFYVIFHFKSQFLNPLVFVLFSSFPGLSIIGGIIGAILYIVLFLNSKKLPTKHIIDCFSISFFSSLIINLIVVIFSTKISFKDITFPILIIELLIYVFLFIFLVKSFQKARFKDGSITFLFLIFFSFLTFIADIIIKSNKIFLKNGYEDYLWIVIFIVSIYVFIKQERIFSKGQKQLRRFSL